jgi:sigma-B regulation protein RsbU (phosphoserine phosphatase)
MTLFYAIIDAEARSVRWVCAGHDPPITYDPHSQIFGEIKGGGIPLGVEERWVYEEYAGEPPPQGQVIVIGTDGIWEARNPAEEMFGKDALREIIRANAHRTAEQISLAVTDALAGFRGPRAQEDDITLVVLKFDPVRG